MVRIFHVVLIVSLFPIFSACSVSGSDNVKKVSIGGGETMLAASSYRADEIDKFANYCEVVGFEKDTNNFASCILQLKIANFIGNASAFENRFNAETRSLAQSSSSERLNLFERQCEEIGIAPSTESYANCLLKMEIAFHQAWVFSQNNRAIERRMAHFNSSLGGL